MGMIWWTFYSAKVSASTQNLPKFYAAIMILGFAALVGVFWEFYELIVDRLITKIITYRFFSKAACWTP